MAIGALTYHFQITLSDVDSGVYESLDLRLARHPSETMRYLITRTLAYCLSFEEGIAFSKGGLHANEDPALSVHDLTGQLLKWIDIGAPSAERLHKAAKAAGKVALYTYTDLTLLRKEAASRPIHKLEHIQVFRVEPTFLDQIDDVITRNSKFELTRNENQLYLSIDGKALEGTLTHTTLVG